MKLETDFNQAVEEWIKHCDNPQVILDSSAKAIRDCVSYRKIVSMGYEALPLIRQLYDRDNSDNLELLLIQGHGLAAVVREIVGDAFQIPDNIRGRILAIEDYTKSWLDENMYKYNSIK